MRNRLWWLRMAAVIVLGGALIYGVLRYSGLNKPRSAMTTLTTNKAVAVTVELPHKETVNQTVSLIGAVQSKDTLNVVAMQGARVTEVDAEVGQTVTAGDVLAKLDSSAQQTQLLQAQANLKQAEAKYSQKTIVDSNQVNIAKDNVVIAQAKLNALRNDPVSLHKAQAAYQAAKNKLAAIQQNIAFEQSAQSPDSLSVIKAENQLKALQDGSSTLIVSNKNSDRSNLNNLLAAINNLKSVEEPSSSYGIAVANAQTDLNDAQNALNEYTVNNNVTSSVYYSSDSQLAKLQQAAVNAQESLDVANVKWSEAIKSAQQQVSKLTVSEANSSQAGQSQNQQALQNAQEAIDMAKAKRSNALQKLNQQLIAEQDAVSADQINLESLQSPDPNTLQQAQSNLQSMQSKLQMVEHPADQGTIDALSASVDLAKARLKEAQDALDQMTVRAPFTGTITARDITIGSAVRSNSTMFTLMGNVKELAAQVDEQHLGAIRVGDEAVFSVASDPAHTYKAKVMQISPTADTQSLSFNVVLVPEDATLPLIPGETVSIQVAVQDIPDALMIPEAAIVNQNGHTQVFVVKANGIVALKDVTTGYSNGAQTQITTGLTPQDKVVTMGQTYLATGDHVKVSTPDGKTVAPTANTAHSNPNKTEGADKNRSGKKAGDKKKKDAQADPQGAQQ